MRDLSIVSFNVNGLLSFMKRRGYTESTFSELLESVCVNSQAGSAAKNVERPDIICIQECKMSFNEDLNNSTGCPGDYDSYFSLTENNKRYSGVVTYCLKSTVVLEAARGLSWLEEAPRQFDMNQKLTAKDLDRFASDVSEARYAYGVALSEIDGEGRCVITDHGHFVLLNLYVPLLRGRTEENDECDQMPFDGLQTQSRSQVQEETAESVDSERLRYRLAFHMYLDLALHLLEQLCGRRVILAGDFNIILGKEDCHGDHGGLLADDCESVSSAEISETKSFDEAYSWVRKLNIQMIQRFGLIDAYRHCHPDVKNKYTCWNQMNQSRVRNQGARIDLFLISKELADRPIRSEILDHIYGSDHCPISLFLKLDESVPIDTVNIKRSLPSICSRYLPQCKQRQSTISQFLASANGGAKPPRDQTSRAQKRPPPGHPLCKHGASCVKKKVTKPGANKGRFYWSCPKSDQQKCNTFVWIEQTSPREKISNDILNFINK
ncbi:apurinic/apyrimidinicendonuclease-like protein [Cryptosporidium canis]|uniref:DNA-(apurinic or apyrimidinic site) endonuclease 2 n=1 Tax=Cryptosporidium canis TaxID=195482 RepID=A0A9D5DE66_9CRYT|nr:apurinic/apyrimidinicendonuclease-like protein [Cryptosporidium canis]